MKTWVRAGDCLELLTDVATNSVDAIVTDPPYGIGFMGAEWDRGVPAQATWEACLRVLKPGGHMLAFASPRTQHSIGTRIEAAGFEIRDVLIWMYGQGMPHSHDVGKALGASWDGWGTGLKPSYEPIIMARKPLVATVTRNVEVHGTGALNLKACSVPRIGKPGWPGNLLHDGSPGALACFPHTTSGAGPTRRRAAGKRNAYGTYREESDVPQPRPQDSGSAARFFYCAKASAQDRNSGCASNPHPTVKPTQLMRYLCRLVTPPGGLVCDPYAGSGHDRSWRRSRGVRFRRFRARPSFRRARAGPHRGGSARERQAVS